MLLHMWTFHFLLNQRDPALLYQTNYSKFYFNPGLSLLPIWTFHSPSQAERIARTWALLPCLNSLMCILVNLTQHFINYLIGNCGLVDRGSDWTCNIYLLEKLCERTWKGIIKFHEKIMLRKHFWCLLHIGKIGKNELTRLPTVLTKSKFVDLFMKGHIAVNVLRRELDKWLKFQKII